MKAKFLVLPLFLVCSAHALAAGKLTCGKWKEEEEMMDNPLARNCVYHASPSSKTLSKKSLFNEAFTALGADWDYAKHIPMKNYRKSFRIGKGKEVSLGINWENANKVSVEECYNDNPHINSDDYISCSGAYFERRGNQIIIFQYKE